MDDIKDYSPTEAETLDSREVAEMVGRQHKHLLRDINGYIENIKQGTEPKVGLSTAELKVKPSEFSIPSIYTGSTGREPPCFLVTKKGCGFITNKLTGEKGMEFTALYATRFNIIEEREKIAIDGKAAKSGKTPEELTAANKRTTAMLLNVKNRAVSFLQKLYDQTGTKPEYRAMALSDFCSESGIHLPRMTFQDMGHTYDKSAIAEKLGVYFKASNSKVPHAQIIGVIISTLDVSEDGRERLPYYNNGHDGVDYQYAESVVEKVRTWTEAHGGPSTVTASGKNYVAVYRERSRIGVSKEAVDLRMYGYLGHVDIASVQGSRGELRRDVLSLLILCRLRSRDANQELAEKWVATRALDRSIKKTESADISFLLSTQRLSKLREDYRVTEDRLAEIGQRITIAPDLWQSTRATLDDLCNLCNCDPIQIREDLHPTEKLFSEMVFVHNLDYRDLRNVGWIEDKVDTSLTHATGAHWIDLARHTESGRKATHEAFKAVLPEIAGNALTVITDAGGIQHLIDKDGVDIGIVDRQGQGDTMEKITYNVQETAAALGLCVGAVYDLTYRPDFPTVWVGNRILIPCESLTRWLEAQEGEQL